VEQQRGENELGQRLGMNAAGGGDQDVALLKAQTLDQLANSG
jgi:hypothetical protein